TRISVWMNSARPTLSAVPRCHSGCRHRQSHMENPLPPAKARTDSTVVHDCNSESSYNESTCSSCYSILQMVALIHQLAFGIHHLGKRRIGCRRRGGAISKPDAPHRGIILQSEIQHLLRQHHGLKFEIVDTLKLTFQCKQIPP